MFSAMKEKDSRVMRRLLDPLQSPETDVNSTCFGLTPLLEACWGGYAEGVELLLRHPAIEVNCRSRHGSTPLLMACTHHRLRVVELLLGDPRVDINAQDSACVTPLWTACRWGYLDIAKRLLALEKPPLLDVQGRHYNGAFSTPMQIAVRQEHSEVSHLLMEFRNNPLAVGHRLRLEVVMPSAAGFFGLVVFLCEDLVRLRGSDPKDEVARRFFLMCLRLPLEMQMTVCLRAFRSTADIIFTQFSEPVFRALATSSWGP